MSKCPLLIPDNESLKSFNYKSLIIPPENDLEQLRQTIGPLTANIKAKICLYSGICIPGIFPVIFNHNRGVQSSNFNEFGVSGNLGLKMMWSMVEEESFICNEAFLIHLNDGKKVFLPPELLTPPLAREDLRYAFTASTRIFFYKKV